MTPLRHGITRDVPALSRGAIRSGVATTNDFGKSLFLTAGHVLLEFAPRGAPQAVAYPK